VPEPKGGFYLFPNFTRHRERMERIGIVSDVELCKRLLEDTGVAILPGSCFGCPAGALTARLSYVDFDGARALAAAEQLSPHNQIEIDFLEECCPKILKAVDLIGGWLRG
jgi:aspartate aminotransferase